MRILRHRPTRHFVALLVACRCGERFLHRLDRRLVGCLSCGRVEDLARMLQKLRRGRGAERRRTPRAARLARA